MLKLYDADLKGSDFISVRKTPSKPVLKHLFSQWSSIGSMLTM